MSDSETDTEEIVHLRPAKRAKILSAQKFSAMPPQAHQF